MRQYYAYVDGQQLGPMSLDKLQLLNIEKETLVWYEGLSEWVVAEQVEELAAMFVVNPPPLPFTTPPPIQPESEIIKEKVPTTKKKRKWLYISLFLLVCLLIGGGIYYAYSIGFKIQTTETVQQEEQKKAREIEQKANDVKREYQAKLQDLYEKQRYWAGQVSSLEYQLVQAEVAHNRAVSQLNQAKKFQLGRFKWEKEEELARASNEVGMAEGQYVTVEAKLEKARNNLQYTQREINQLIENHR